MKYRQISEQFQGSGEFESRNILRLVIQFLHAINNFDYS